MAALDEDRLHELLEMGPALISTVDLETILERFLQTARRLTGAEYAALGVLDDDRRYLERFLTDGLTEEEERALGDPPRGRGILGLLITEPKPLRLSDLTAHPKSYGCPAGHPTMRSFLGVPILIDGLAWGNLYLTNKQDGEFDETDELAAVTLASWAGIAIAHARLIAAASERQARLERALRRLEATQAIAVAIGAEVDLQRVLELIAKRGRAIVEARSIVILLQNGDALGVAASAGHGHAQIGMRIPIADSTSGEVMRSQRPRRVDDAGQLGVPADRLGIEDAHSVLLVPLVYRGRSLGVLAAFDRERSISFAEEDEQVLVAFAASAATAVAVAQNVAADRLRHSLDAAEAERKHWARELHDETLQALGGLKLLAAATRRGTSDPESAAALERLTEGLETEIENLHRIITELRPAALDDLGLRPAIQALVERHRETSDLDIECRLRLPDPAVDVERLRPELETTVYRLVQEALSNIVKHADAEHVSLSVEALDGRIAIEVIDDGCGFDLERVDTGFGLTGMRERAALAGGSVNVTSSSEGTRMEASLPADHTG